MNWIHTPIATGLGWASLHFAWQGILIGFVLATALFFARQATTRYAVACLALFGMPVVFAVTFAFAIPESKSASPSPIVEAVIAAVPVAGQWVQRRALEFEDILPWLVPFWMMGTALVGAYRFTGWLAVQRVRRTSVGCASTDWRQKLIQLANQMGVTTQVQLLESGLTEAPIVSGLFRPMILIPAGMLAGLPAAHIEAILLHELAHIRRSDYLVNLLQTLVESILFYHPVVWWVTNVVRVERENCCDDAAVVAQGGDKHTYAAALIELEERRIAGGREPALAATGGTLMNRIQRLLKPSAGRTIPTSASSPIIVIGIVAGLCAAVAVAQNQQPTPYQNWLDQDVVYIISVEERSAFNRLSSDEERNRFIEQFWLRRDPSAPPPQNKAMIEHYRRIRYSNERYKEGEAGWLTDRGRIYITYGPPDQIESHPNEGREAWAYRRIEGLGDYVTAQFVKRAGGDYRLVYGPVSALAPAPQRR